MAPQQVTRRQFLLLGSAVVAGGLAGSRSTALAAPQGTNGPVTIYRLSVRGRRGSNAAKRHNANLLFATAEAADANRAHPGDRSRVVGIVVNPDEFDRLFTSRNSLVADLRSLGGPTLVGDCNRNGEVAINELIRGVNIALGGAPVSECMPFDRVADGQVSVTELIRGVRNALG